MFQSNSCQDTGGSLLFDGGDQALTISGSQFLDGAAATCGGLALLTASHSTVSDSTFARNRATDDGGAVCYAQPPLAKTQVVGVAGQTLELTAQTGDISVVNPGQLIPSATINCSWHISLPGLEGCSVELVFASINAIKPLTNFLLLTDNATGAVLYNETGPLAAMPPPFRSSSPEGLTLNFWSASNGDPYYTGFQASWVSVCSDNGTDTSRSDFTSLVFDGVTLTNNSAGGQGGAVRAAQRFSSPFPSPLPFPLHVWGWARQGSSLV